MVEGVLKLYTERPAAIKPRGNKRIDIRRRYVGPASGSGEGLDVVGQAAIGSGAGLPEQHGGRTRAPLFGAQQIIRCRG